MFGTSVDVGVVSRLVTDVASRLATGDALTLALYTISNNVITDMLLPLSEPSPPGGPAMVHVADYNLPYIDGLRRFSASSSDLTVNDAVIRHALGNLALRQLEQGGALCSGACIAQLEVWRNGTVLCSGLVAELPAVDVLHAAEKRDSLTNSHAEDDVYVRKLRTPRDVGDLALLVECVARGQQPQFPMGKLATLLKNALMGNCRTQVMATVSPAGRKFALTQFTLRLLAKLQRGKCKALKQPYAHIHTMPTTAAVPQDAIGTKRVEELRAELSSSLAQLQEQLRAAGVDPLAPSLASVPVSQRESVSRLLAQAQEDTAHSESLVVSAEDLAKQSKINYLQLQRALHRVPHPSAIDPPAKLLMLARDPLLSGAGAFPLVGDYWQVCRTGTYSANTLLLHSVQVLNDHCTITLSASSGDYTLAVPAMARVLVNGVAVRDSAVLQHGDRVVLGATACFLFVRGGAKHSLPVAAADLASVDSVCVPESERVLGIVLQGGPEDVGYWRPGNAHARTLTVNSNAALGTGRGTAYDYAMYEVYRDTVRDMLTIAAPAQAQTLATSATSAADAPAEAKAADSDDGKPGPLLRAALRETELTALLPHVGEANAVCSELGQTQLRAVVKVNQFRHVDQEQAAPAVSVSVSDNTTDSPEDPSAPASGELRRRQRMDSGVVVQVTHAETGVAVRCSATEFGTLLQEWRELYTAYVLTGDRALPESDEQNPFHLTPHGAQLAGTVRLYLQPLFYLLPVSERSPVLDYKGDTVGRLELVLTPVPRDDEDEEDAEELTTPRTQTSSLRTTSSVGRRGAAPEVYFREGDLGEIEGQRLRLRLHIKRASGLPKQCSKDVFVRYRWPLTGEVFESEPCMATSANPRINHTHVLELPAVSRAEIQALHDGVMELQVLGHYPHAADSLGADPVWQRLLGLVQTAEGRLSKAEYEAEDAAQARYGVEVDEAEVDAARKAALDQQALQVLSLAPEELLQRLQGAYDRQTVLFKTKVSLEARLEEAEEARAHLEDQQRRAAEKKKDKKDKKHHYHDSGRHATEAPSSPQEDHSSRLENPSPHHAANHNATGAMESGLAAVERARLQRELDENRAQLSREAEEVGRLRSELTRQQEQLGVLRSRLQGGAEEGDAQSSLLAEELEKQTQAAANAEARAAELTQEAETVRQRLLKAKELRDRDREELEREAAEKQQEHDDEVKRLREALKAARMGGPAAAGGKSKGGATKAKQADSNQSSSKSCAIM